MEKERIIKKSVDLRDHMGRPREAPPSPLTATWCQGTFYQGDARVGKFDENGVVGDLIRERRVRAQVPYIVTLLVYNSEFQVTPTAREYFLYAPMEIQKAAELAFRLWQRWERPPRPKFAFGDMRKQYPKVEDGIVAEPIGDSDYAAHWKSVSWRKHKAAGHPEDPFAFTCLDQDVRMYKAADFQAGLHVKIM